MERVALMRVEQWRFQWKLHNNTDFTYAFASYDNSGAWRTPSCRYVAAGAFHIIEDDLIPQVAAVAESSGSRGRPASWPAAESRGFAESILPGQGDAPLRGTDP